MASARKCNWLWLKLLPLVAHLISIMVYCWSKTCRVRVINDPRPSLRTAGRPYVYALLHGQQIAAVLANDEAQLAAMVSRSTDGDLLAPSLRARRILAVRGSGRRGRAAKGGENALRRLIALNAAGMPVLLAADGPRGPRGTVHGGIVTLALATGAVILVVQAKARNFFCVSKTWDQTQLPWPGTTIDLTFLAVIEPSDYSSHAATRLAVQTALMP